MPTPPTRRRERRWEELAARFQAENPDVQLQFNIYDSESYKKSIRNWLTGAPPDVVYWYAGYRMQQLATPGPAGGRERHLYRRR